MSFIRTIIFLMHSLNGGWRGPAAGHAGVGGVRPGPVPGGGQPRQ